VLARVWSASGARAAGARIPRGAASISGAVKRARVVALVSCRGGACLARHSGAGHARQHKRRGKLRLSGARARRAANRRRVSSGLATGARLSCLAFGGGLCHAVTWARNVALHHRSGRGQEYARSCLTARGVPLACAGGSGRNLGKPGGNMRPAGTCTPAGVHLVTEYGGRSCSTAPPSGRVCCSGVCAATHSRPLTHSGRSCAMVARSCAMVARSR
jgi:hypothetical protein